MAVLTRALVKTHLNIATAVTTHDDELDAFIGRAEAAVAQRVGPLESTARTVRVRPHYKALRVPGPIVSLTSITDYSGNAVTLADLHTVSLAGIITYDDDSAFTSTWYDVVYQQGRSTCPDDLKLACLELVRHLWETQRGPTARPGTRAAEAAASTVPGAAYMFPHRVTQLLAPHIIPKVAV